MKKPRYRTQDLVSEARALGMEIIESPGEIAIIARRHKGTRKVLHGVVCWPDGWCVDATIQLGIARLLKPLRAREILGIK
jgi:hypothetical protein